jgi:beta-mannosidase
MRSQRRVGLRTLEVRRTPDAAGASFEFVVNGRPVFAKGANWIPADSFPTRVTPGQYRHLLESARDAHFNMLRVWGGGIYEHDVFYDLCDELGLLVWQDFMFACALYPGDDRFVASVRAEAEHQVRRLRHRACLALWCGNNEMEWGWFSWNWRNQYPPSVWADYQRLFDDLLPEICRRLDPTRLYWPSSPASETASTGQPNDYGRGDVHYWEVWGDPKATPAYYEGQRPRFASEFGFQSFPEPRTVAAYARPDERAPDSAVMLMHQKAPQGQREDPFPGGPHVRRPPG